MISLNIWDDMHRTFKFDNCLCKCYMATQIMWDENYWKSEFDDVVYVNVTWYHKIYDMYWTSKFDNCLCKCYMQTQRIWDENYWTSKFENTYRIFCDIIHKQSSNLKVQYISSHIIFVLPCNNYINNHQTCWFNAQTIHQELYGFLRLLCNNVTFR
jgi:hypothetical protein